MISVQEKEIPSSVEVRKREAKFRSVEQVFPMSVLLLAQTVQHTKCSNTRTASNIMDVDYLEQCQLLKEILVLEEESVEVGLPEQNAKAE